ncbi:MAG: S41 family peptidase [Limnochordia bacterium]|nr:S41 family peptidase [Limnochordia bacterium]MDD2629385.1 S41 family peptidase [Limnochordia bacterium]MDD4518324.1 S41 family peptidase [Limnochordia bacterium]
MTKRRVLIVLIILGLMAGVLSVRSFFEADAEDPVDDQARQLFQIMALMESFYYKPIDSEQMLKGYVHYGNLEAMLLDLVDPYTQYLPPRMYEEMKVDTTGNFSGVGIVITIYERQLTVVSPIAGTPGYEAGLQSGDEIMAIDGRPTKYMSMLEAVDCMRGPEGTAVQLTIQRGEEQFDVEIIRAKVESPDINEAIMVTSSVAYVRINEFKLRTAEELDAALTKLKRQGMEGLILDLRDNPGGTLGSAIDVSSMFLPAGDTVHEVFRNSDVAAMFMSRGDTKTYVSRNGERISHGVKQDGKWCGLPVVVLINRGSASASEIVAGALKDRAGGLLVGNTSFGKGLVQAVLELPNGAAMRLTIAEYLTAGGVSINDKGIEPDFVVNLPEPTEEEAKALRLRREYFSLEDMQVQKALEVVQEMLIDAIPKAS